MHLSNWQKLEKLTLILGILGVILNAVALITLDSSIGYVAIFLGRLAAFTYASAVDKVRWYYSLPLGFSAMNTTVNSEMLIFLEVMVQGIIYQIIAWRVFEERAKMRENPWLD